MCICMGDFVDGHVRINASASTRDGGIGTATLLVTDVPFTARIASIGTHWHTIAFRQELGLPLSFFTRYISALRLTARRGVSTWTTPE
jgi:hypothetical protein